MNREHARVAVCIPCKDEASAIASVIHSFRAVLPDAEIVVIDNASTDGTGPIAQAAGARVIREDRAGKGRAVARAFADVEADC